MKGVLIGLGLVSVAVAGWEVWERRQAQEAAAMAAWSAEFIGCDQLVVRKIDAGAEDLAESLEAADLRDDDTSPGYERRHLRREYRLERVKLIRQDEDYRVNKAAWECRAAVYAKKPK